MKKIILSTIILVAASIAQAGSCPDLSGVYESEGVQLTIVQKGCEYLKTNIFDGLSGGGVSSEYFPSKGEYADPRFSRDRKAVRIDSFENDQFVSQTNLINDFGTGRTKTIKMEIELDENLKNLSVQHFELNGSNWSNTQSQNFKRK